MWEVHRGNVLSDKLILFGTGALGVNQGGHGPNPAGQTVGEDLELVHPQKKTLKK